MKTSVLSATVISWGLSMTAAMVQASVNVKRALEEPNVKSAFQASTSSKAATPTYVMTHFSSVRMVVPAYKTSDVCARPLIKVRCASCLSVMVKSAVELPP